GRRPCCAPQCDSGRDGPVAGAGSRRAVKARDVQLIVAESEGSAAARGAELMAESARKGDEIVLTGGRTPGRAYELAAGLEPDWSRANVWWGDERRVRPADERSNYGLARRPLFDRLAAQPGRLHRIRGEDDPPAAAASYE